MSEKNQAITYVIPHTHWDREWYNTFNQFRFRLVEMIDNLLEVLERNADFKYFNLDCQTVVLEDYLEIRPENKTRLSKLILDGRIGIGPWYAQSSPLLQTGEGLIRNILRGFSISKTFGVKPVNMGWTPDQFIQSAQMPQIFQGFGIEHAAFSRGMGNQYDEIPGLNMEFFWEGLDGSRVLTFHLMNGYGLNAHLGNNPEQALNVMVMGAGKMNNLPWSTNIRLSFHGSDHTGPEESILEAINIWNDEEEIVGENGHVKLASWDEYLTDFKQMKPDLKTVYGEIAGRRYQITLHGVFSSNIYIKQRSFAIHNLLERWSEPYSAFANLYHHQDMRGFIKESWRWLLQNQAHDSIWTSSIDQVTKEMITRFDWSEQIAEETFRRSAQWIVQHLKPTKDSADIKIVVFNPLPWPRSDLIHAIVGERGQFGNMVLVDEQNKEITTRIEAHKSGDEDRLRRRMYVPSHGSLGQSYRTLIFSADNVPGLGYKTYFFRKRDPVKDQFEPLSEGMLDGNDYYLENEVIRISVEEDGTITLIKKIEAGEHKYTRLHLLENIADAGDGWEYHPLKGIAPLIPKLEKFKTQILEATEHIGTLKLEYSIQIPTELSEDKKQRSETTVQIPCTTYISLRRGKSPLVEFKTTLINRAKNHRMRILFPTPFSTDEIIVNGHFGTFSRKIALPDGSKWAHHPESIWPHQKFVSIWDSTQNKGFALVTKGLSEYEAIHNPDGTVSLALTLYRSTGEWGNHIGVTPPMTTPLAQMLDCELTFEYGIIPQTATWDNDAEPIYRMAEEFWNPLRWEEDFDSFRVHPDKSNCTLPYTNGLLDIEPKNIMLSAFKQPEQLLHGEEIKNSVIVRVFNIKHEESKAILKFNFDIASVEFVDLKEDPLISQPTMIKTKNTIEFTVGASKIMTLKVQPK